MGLGVLGALSYPVSIVTSTNRGRIVATVQLVCRIYMYDVDTCDTGRSPVCVCEWGNIANERIHVRFALSL